MYTLRDFVADLPMRELKTLVKPSSFSRIRVNSISVQELPLDTFVREDEIILSTLIGCLDNREIFKQFLSDIRNSRAAALVVSFKDPDYRLDEEIIQFAMEIGLPILSLPWEVRFAEVIHFTMQRISEKNTESYKVTRDRLFTAYFASHTLDDAARILSRFFECPVAISGKNMDIKGRSCENACIENSAVMEIRIHSILWGYLHICNPENHYLSNQKLLEQHILLPLSMWFNKENIEDMIVLKMKNDFVWDLANKNYESFLEMVQQGTKLGFDLSSSFVCIAFCIRPEDPAQIVDEYSSVSAQMASFVEDLIVMERKNLRQNIMFADRGLLFLAFVDVSQSNASAITENFVSSIDTAFTKEYPGYQMYWGISDVSPENSELFQHLCNNAQLALKYCLSDKNSERVFTYQDTRFHQVISELSSNKNIKKYAVETLEPLLNYDKSSSMDLVNTLVELIKNDGNTSQTARDLHLNRQSLLYRLKKIESLTGMSLSQHRDLFLLELFTRIHSYY